MQQEVTKKEFRSFSSSFEVRDAGESGKSPVIMGYAARFNELSDPIMGMFREKIAPGAFDEAIKKSDPRALFNHDPNHVLGRKSAGTLRLKILPDGLHYEITPPKSDFVDNLIESMKRGDIRESSFAFTVEIEEWIEPAKAGDLPTRVIKRVGQLYDVSPVTYPAYPTATSEARSAEAVFSGYGDWREVQREVQWRMAEDEQARRKPKKPPENAEHDELMKRAKAAEENAYEFERKGCGWDVIQLMRERARELREEVRASLYRMNQQEEPSMQQEQKEQRTMGQFFQQVRMNNVPRETRAAEGQNYTVDEDGGYLVEPQYEQRLLKLIETESVLYSRVNRITMSRGNTLVQNYIPESSREDGQRNGTVQAYWIDEADKYTDSKLRFNSKLTRLSKLIGMAYATEEVLEDASVLESTIARAFEQEFSFKIDDAILNGVGLGDSPSGILNSTALVTVPAESGQAAGSVVAANILAMWNALPSRNRKNAVWLINQDVEPQLIQMYIAVGTSGGVPVYMPSTGLSGAQYGTIMGKPVLPLEQCGALGTLGDIVLVDPTAYDWIQKGSLRSQSSIHVKFDTDQTCFKFTLRASGAPSWDAPITPYKGTTARSPFVTLAPRA